jgi:hypothetical protein
MADSNSAKVGFIEEVTWGTTPASALQTLRITGESLQDQEESTESAEILSDRALRDVIRTGEFSQGDISGELSYGTLDTLLEGVMADTWTTNVLENGSTKKSYTFEKDIAVSGSPANQFITFKACRIDSLALTFPVAGVIDYTLGIMGKHSVGATATAGSGAYTAAGTTEPLASEQVVITEASTSPGDVRSLSLNISNNLRRQMALGTAAPIGYGYGGFRCSGVLELYFLNRTLYDKYVAETKTELEATVTASNAAAYVFTIPAARWGVPTINLEGVNGDIFASFPWTAVNDVATDTMINITRVP